MPFAAPSGSNTYIPVHEAREPTLELTRDPKKFRLNQYVKTIPVSKDQGYYLALDGDEAARVVDADQGVWEDGSDAPADNEKQDHEFRPYRTVRRKPFGFRIGYKTAKQASWDLVMAHARTARTRAMTLRTIKANELIWNPANWAIPNAGISNTLAATDNALAGAGGGAWSTSTTAQTFILRCLMGAAELIDERSNGVVNDVSGFILVISPNLARKIRQSPEFHEYLRGSPEALASLKGDLAAQNPNFKFGLPPTLYGFTVVVENAVRITSPKGAPVVRTRIVPNDAAAILSRTDGVVAETESAPDFSTVSFRMLEEMTTEIKDDPDNRRHVGRVVEEYTVLMQAPQTGFLITGLS
jgi:hypothetical protein